MTDLRTAAQQALEALMDDQYRMVEVVGGHYEYKTDLAIGALKAALAQEQAEPVAWVRLEAWKSGKDWPDDCFTSLPAEGLTPLYTAPPKRKPLTEEDAAALIASDPRILKEFGTATSGAAMQLVRAVERAHGIGGQDE